MLSKVIVAASASGASGHGWIHNPISKNEMAYHHFVDGMPDSLRWEPQTCYWGNQAGVRIDGNGYSCGAKEGPAAQGLNVWQKWYDAAKVAVPSITPGQDILVQITITADHGGQAWFTIACADHIGEDVAWTYLERSASDRDHHFMPSNPGIYAWATSEAASTMGNEIKASWTLPEDFTCPSGKVVGRWLWKTGSSCNDFNNVGRPTETFNQTEYQRVLNAFHPHTWMKVACTDPPETFISCLDFQMSGMPPSPPGPSPPTPPPAPPAPTPPPAPSKPKTTKCCWSNWGDDTTCGQYTGPGGQCNTDHSKKCTSDSNCPKEYDPLVKHAPCPLMEQTQVAPKCCWSKWGDADTCGSWAGPGAQCNTELKKTCKSDADCPAGPAPTPPAPPSPPTPPTPPSPPAPPSPGPGGQAAVSACHDAAKAFCSSKGGFCKACQAWGNWGDMFFVTICNDAPSTCHQPLMAAGNVTCFCQKAGGCSVAGTTCAGPSYLV